MLDLMKEPGQEELLNTVSRRDLAVMEDSAFVHTILTDEGRVLACGGIVPYWKDRAEAWVVVSAFCKKEFLALHRLCLEFLEGLKVRRVEASVVIGEERSHRWVQLLGFELEATRLRGYLPDGKDVSLYARVK